jgi:hypothetical protein
MRITPPHMERGNPPLRHRHIRLPTLASQCEPASLLRTALITKICT